uniref:Uncharacterized protein n=1 Tax=Romanomermis culicivorax TaxID=13658 RepID=A0A915IU24_ROMCU
MSATIAVTPPSTFVFNADLENRNGDDKGMQNERLTKALAALSACKQKEDIGDGSLKSQEKDQIKIERSCSLDEKINNNNTNNNNNNAQDHQHCDCCYCEMFGQHQSRLGRDDFMQIRERLRQKLKKNKDAFISPSLEKNVPQPPPVLCQNNATKSCSQSM